MSYVATTGQLDEIKGEEQTQSRQLIVYATTNDTETLLHDFHNHAHRIIEYKDKGGNSIPEFDNLLLPSDEEKNEDQRANDAEKALKRLQTRAHDLNYLHQLTYSDKTRKEKAKKRRELFSEIDFIYDESVFSFTSSENQHVEELRREQSKHIAWDLTKDKSRKSVSHSELGIPRSFISTQDTIILPEVEEKQEYYPFLVTFDKAPSGTPQKNGNIVEWSKSSFKDLSPTSIIYAHSITSPAIKVTSLNEAKKRYTEIAKKKKIHRTDYSRSTPTSNWSIKLGWSGLFAGIGGSIALGILAFSPIGWVTAAIVGIGFAITAAATTLFGFTGNAIDNIKINSNHKRRIKEQKDIIDKLAEDIPKLEKSYGYVNSQGDTDYQGRLLAPPIPIPATTDSRNSTPVSDTSSITAGQPSRRGSTLEPDQDGAKKLGPPDFLAMAFGPERTASQTVPPSIEGTLPQTQPALVAAH